MDDRSPVSLSMQVFSRRFVRSAMALLLLATGSVGAQTPVSREPRRATYESAAIDANGDLVIVTANGQTVTVPKEADQTSFSAPVLSSSKAAVGALAMFPNCCT